MVSSKDLETELFNETTKLYFDKFGRKKSKMSRKEDLFILTESIYRIYESRENLTLEELERAKIFIDLQEKLYNYSLEKNKKGNYIDTGGSKNL